MRLLQKATGVIYNTEQEPERNIQTGTGKDSFVMVLMVERYPGFSPITVL